MTAPENGSPRARAEADLLWLLVDTIEDYAIFALDPDGIVRSWNAGAERLKGYRPDEIIGRHFSVFYTAEDIEAGRADRGLAIAAADGHFEDEGWRVRNDGSRFWANTIITALRGDDGRLLGFGKITRDLTERKRGEDALHQSEERFRLLVSGVRDYAIFLLEPDGTVASWNLGAERLKGYRADEIIGRHFSVFYAEEDRRRGLPQAGLKEALDNGRWETEGWRVRKDGTRFWANILLTPLRDDHGELKGFTKITRDLTERKRNDDALRGVLERERDAAAKLRELDRMRSELIAVVAHDLRAPAGVLQNLLHLLVTGWTKMSDGEKLESLERIQLRMATLASLTDDVFDVAMIDTGQIDMTPRPFSVVDVIDQIVSDVKTSDPLRSVDKVIDDGVVAFADPRRTWQVLNNLVMNAMKFSPPESTITISARPIGQHVEVSVSDTGPGIPADEQDRIFDRFARLPRDGGVIGSGMGLFIARSLAEAQGGSISVTSDATSGSTFTVRLPAADPGSG